ncbi:MAG: DevR family CRISPR-associated autoregulator [Chloroflexi bacterium]|nr:DevR family CRISPR-associated autoregulator [Chloroflexota bacterium]
MTTLLYSLSISARATLDLHSLNNEGGEGNQIQTRMVNVIDQNGLLQNVNAISGDMFKHIQAEYLTRLALERDLPLCAGCRTFNANRINADPDFIVRTKDMNDADTLSELLTTCAVDDIEGILITEGGRSIPRKSVIEFGWVVGVPGSVQTDSYFHVKYATERSSGKRSEDREATEASGSNLGQAIFHRPASSGIYAAICHLELARIGFNDITQEYALDADQRAARARALLESVLYTFMQPNGAMRSAQAPHMVDFSGVVSLSSGPVPAPTISPLKDDYGQQIKAVKERLDGIAPGAVEVYDFRDLSGFTEIIAYLAQNTAPYTLAYNR